MKLVKKYFFLFFTAILYCFLFSCWGPLITPEEIRQINDKQNPLLEIITPQGTGSFASMISVQGRVTDDNSENNIKILRYEIIGTSVSGQCSWDDRGYFEIKINAMALNENVQIKIIAVDYNGNQASCIIPFYYQAFPGFQIIPRSKGIEIIWDDNQYNTQVDLYLAEIAEGGNTPNFNLLPDYPDITSGTVLTRGIENGKLYSIQLRTETEFAVECSPILETIPLSHLSLVPNIESNFKQNILFWRDFSTIKNYLVLRSQYPQGPYEPLNRNMSISRNFFIDETVIPGETYYYKIQPNNYNPFPSAWARAKSSSLPQLGDYLGSIPGDSIFDVAIRDDWAYLADYSGHILVTDITQGDSPRIHNSIPLSGRIKHLNISGDLLLASAEEGGLHLLDISRQGSPELLYTITPPQENIYTHASLAVGNLVIAAQGDAGIYVYEYGIMDVPRQIIQMDQVSTATDLYWTGQYLLAAANKGGLYIYHFDIEDNLIQDAHYSDIAPVVSIDLKDSRLFVAQKEIGLGIYDFQITADSIIITEDQIINTTDTTNTTASAEDVIVKNNFAYIANGTAGLAIAYISPDSQARVVQEINDFKQVHHLAVAGDKLYLAADDQGMNILSATEPGDFKTASAIENIIINQMEIQGDFLYAACKDAFRIYDLSDPDNPNLLSKPNNYSCDTMSIHNELALLTNHDTGITLLNISNPGSIPYPYYSPDTSGYKLVDAEIYSDYLFAAARINNKPEILIYDISDPNSEIPLPIHFVEENSWSWHKEIQVSQEYLQITDELNGLLVYSIENPESPVFLPNNSILTKENYLFKSHTQKAILVNEKGLSLYDISNRDNPEFLDNFIERRINLEQADLNEFYEAGAFGNKGVLVFDYEYMQGMEPLFQWNKESNSVKQIALSDKMLIVFIESSGNKGLQLFYK